jgi:hypothetical protein
MLGTNAEEIKKTIELLETKHFATYPDIKSIGMTRDADNLTGILFNERPDLNPKFARATEKDDDFNAVIYDASKFDDEAEALETALEYVRKSRD